MVEISNTGIKNCLKKNCLKKKFEQRVAPEKKIPAQEMDRKKFVQAEKSQPSPPPYHFSDGPSLNVLFSYENAGISTDPTLSPGRFSGPNPPSKKTRREQEEYTLVTMVSKSTLGY